MFIGSLPDPVVVQMLRTFDFSRWPSVQVLCSGSFKIERALNQRYPLLDVSGNDVSLLSVAIGALAAGQDLPFAFARDLAWLGELVPAEAPLVDRTAAVLLALNVAPYASGKANVYKSSHLDHIRARAPEQLEKARKKVQALRSSLDLRAFFADDFRSVMRGGLARGAGIVGFPPTYKGGYEAQYRFLNANVDWQPPAYDVFDPDSVEEVVAELSASGAPWCIFTDRKLEGWAPATEFRAGRQHPIYGYGHSGKAAYRSISVGRSAQFRYQPVDLTRLERDSTVRITPISGAHAAHVKDVYLAKHIIHSGGMSNCVVTIDGMLAGLLVFTLSKRQVYAADEIYLLSDLSTTRDAKLSKLIARLALAGPVIRHLEAQFVRRFGYVVTTAFSDHPVSMKYRGVFELLKRADGSDGRYMLNYGGKTSGEAFSDAYRWWWDNYGEKHRRKHSARNRNQDSQPRVAEAA